ncbi:MAG: hypothetical protein COY40_02025 [Alphaproteobacteria bacterium CG_4_10_14_0_8_um_filter_53_9]|nr:MAG: hypothetical protein COY40_02025 [Alphaproteobacteria bacterium CG_4_10_14_0_8_um_filter_53_9]
MYDVRHEINKILGDMVSFRSHFMEGDLLKKEILLEDDLGLDDVDMENLIHDISERFGRAFSAKSLTKPYTVGSLISLVEKSKTDA